MPLIRGSLLHMAAAHHYRRMQAVQEGEDPERWYTPKAALYALAKQELEAGGPAMWKDLIPLVWNAWEAYEKYYPYDHEEWEILQVEEYLQANVGKGKHLYTQRPDLVVRDRRTGKVYIVDHKTAWRLDHSTLTQHLLGIQFLGYQLFGKAKYKRAFGGILVNRIKVKAPVQFSRTLLERSPHAIRSFPTFIDFWEEQIARFTKTAESPWDWPPTFDERCCVSKYGACPMFESCRHGPSK